MLHEDILMMICGVYKLGNIKSFPIHCFELLDTLGISYYDYNELSEKKRTACKLLSDDAFTLRREIYYDGNINPFRLRFSLMHELGHIMLNHSCEMNHYEEHEANYFASNLLAPRIMITESKCDTVEKVMDTFFLSNEAATYALDSLTCVDYQGNLYTKEMINHFYNRSRRGIVYSIKKCRLCTIEDAYNNDAYCPQCKKSLNIEKSIKISTRKLSHTPVLGGEFI